MKKVALTWICNIDEVFQEKLIIFEGDLVLLAVVC
jgi:hypothetical protein